MSNLLSIGSVVQLNQGEDKIMIICRYPLYNNEGTIGYFDYSACPYPQGQTENQAFYFNHENIEKVWFEGYRDEKEEEMQKLFAEKTNAIPYPRLEVSGSGIEETSHPQTSDFN